MPRPPIKTHIQGHEWTVHYRARVRCDKREVCGLCDTEKHEITICSKLTDEPGAYGRTHREVAIHEFLHASAWFLTEDVVAEMAEDLDSFLNDLDL